MPDWSLIFTATVFVVAGMVKGLIGLGLPTIAMGTLALVMSPLQAAALLVVPSLLTNIWQALAGPFFVAVLRRLWPMLFSVCIGTWAGMGFMAQGRDRLGHELLGMALAAYAVSGLLELRPRIDPKHAWLAGPAVGAVTGLITAATGVFVIPAVPYLQAIGMEKDELVQALGLSFTVSTLALSVNLAFVGAIDTGVLQSSAWATVLAVLGMLLGQVIRSRLPLAAFRRCFFGGLLLLGVYQLVRAVI